MHQHGQPGSSKPMSLLNLLFSSVVMGIVSLTFVRCDVSVIPDLNAVLMSKSLHTLVSSYNSYW